MKEHAKQASKEGGVVAAYGKKTQNSVMKGPVMWELLL